MHSPHRHLALLSLLLLAGCGNDKDRDPKRIDITRLIGRLAPLPPQARNVQVYEVSNSFSSSFWLRFEAPPESITSFLTASPGLGGVAPQRMCTREETAAAEARTVGKARMALPGVVSLSVRTADSCEWHHLQVRSTLPWFDVGQVRMGRLYVIPQDSDANGGTLVVDDEHHAVYVAVSHS
jgi:hypothetical protein